MPDVGGGRELTDNDSEPPDALGTWLAGQHQASAGILEAVMGSVGQDSQERPRVALAKGAG